jgi:steroid delta-isomerase-like uncharacterized protein
MTATTAVTPDEAVAAYAEAKSRADVEAALGHCTEDVVFDTVPFQISVAGREANRAAFEAFFGVFPDYDVELEGTTGAGELLAGWGTLRATMKGSIGSLEATGQRFELPFACVWRIRDGQLAHERFHFDLHQMCDQLGLDAAAVLAEISGATA